MSKDKEMVNINVRVTLTLKKIIDKYVHLDTHINLSDFTRDALREKIKRDAPWFLEEILRAEEPPST